MVNVILPELGEDITKATIAGWMCREGDQIKEGDDIVEVVTDKAVFNVPASASGKVKQIRFKEGEEAHIGAVLAVIDPVN